MKTPSAVARPRNPRMRQEPRRLALRVGPSARRGKPGKIDLGTDIFSVKAHEAVESVEAIPIFFRGSYSKEERV